MNPTTLYIIGNGFDLHHGLKSSYNNFRDDVKCNNFLLYEKIEEYLIFDENWNVLESALADLDAEQLQMDNEEFIIPYGHDDSMHHDYEFFLNETLELLSTNLVKTFKEWINSVEIPPKESIEKVDCIKKENSIFLNFNYTKTLTKIYDIDKNDILHIHGTCENPILGHAFSETLRFNDDENKDTRALNGQELIYQYFKKTFKPTKKIISENKTFFEKLKHIKIVYVLGHSIANVDIEYFKEINKNISNNVEWLVSYRSEKSKKEIENSLKDIGLTSSKITLFQMQKEK